MFRNFCEFWGVLGANFCEFKKSQMPATPSLRGDKVAEAIHYAQSAFLGVNLREFSAKFREIHRICEFFGVNLGVAKNSRKFGGENYEFLSVKRGENV